MYLSRNSRSVRHLSALLALASLGLSVPMVGMACVLLASEPGWAAGQTQALADWAGNEVQRKQWLQGISMVGSGHWDEAGKLIDQLVTDGVSDVHLKRVQDWIAAFTKLQNERRERRLKDYEQYVAWIKEDMKDKKWRRAVATCHRAFTNADDKDAFRKSDFVKELVDGSITAAEEFEKDHKWQNAATIYLYLKEIFPRENRYRDAIERCQEHIRLEYAYAKDSDWETSVANITSSMAKEAFKRIHSDYREQPNFKQMVVDALQQMLRMTEEPKLVKVFDKLKDTDEVQEFRDRIQPHLARAQSRSKMSLTDIIEVFDRVIEINNEIGLFPQAVAIREFVHGSFKPLDQFSDMLWPAETEEFNKHTQGKFYGVGISIRKAHGEPIRVVTPLEDTPAYQAGIRPGDMITHINGKSAAPLSITRAVQEITGPPDTYVNLTIKRSGGEGGKDEKFDVKLKRAEVVIYTIKGQQRNADGSWKFMIDPENHIGYVRMTNFTDETPAELKAALKTLTAQKMRGLILDLRGNPGGTLKAAVDVSNLFLDGDKQIVSTRDRKGQDMQMSTSEPEGEHYADFPLILLVNESSASASEIVAGALQVHHRAFLVGERSFGKGSVQQVLPVSQTRSAFLKLTTARYYLPNGRCLHRDDDSETWGVDPDVAVELVPKEMYKIASARLKSDILKGTGQDKLTDKELDKVLSTQPVTDEEDAEDKPDGDSESKDEKDTEPARDDPNNWPEIDPQLDATLLLMRVRLETDQPWPMKNQALAATPKAESGT